MTCLCLVALNQDFVVSLFQPCFCSLESHSLLHFVSAIISGPCVPFCELQWDVLGICKTNDIQTKTCHRLYLVPKWHLNLVPQLEAAPIPISNICPLPNPCFPPLVASTRTSQTQANQLSLFSDVFTRLEQSFHRTLDYLTLKRTVWPE